MNILQAVVYGVIQGLTEFLPVSSSAHLTLLPWFTGWPDPGLAFDVALHWGTLVGVVFYFRQDVVGFVEGVFRSFQGVRNYQTRMAWQIVAATVPGVIAGLTLDRLAETVFRSPWVVAVMLVTVAIFLAVADRRGANLVPLSEITWRQALLIGCLQAVAIIPGTSRSGITVATALILGIERTAAVRFSFFLSIPIIFGAGVFKSGYLIQNAGSPVLWAGLLSAAASGFAAIHFLLTFVRTRNFTPFVVYRIGLAAVIGLFLLKG